MKPALARAAQAAQDRCMVEVLEVRRATPRDAGEVTALLLALSAGFALAVWAALGVPLFSALLAYAPGGVAEMSLIAIAIDADPAFVATHHMARIFAILFALPLIAGALRRLLAADRAGRGSPPGSRPPREAP